jgi:hypothetical protein
MVKLLNRNGVNKVIHSTAFIGFKKMLIDEDAKKKK